MKVVDSDAPARERVLAATRDSLIEHGMGGTTASTIAARAGLSQGTIFRYFATKPVLLCETAAWILADVRHSAAEDFLALGGSFKDRSALDAIDLAMGVVWRQYERADLIAVHDLFAHARTDADLVALLDEMDGPHRSELHEMARAVLPDDLAVRTDFDAVVDFVLDVIATIAATVAGTAATRRESQLALLRASVHLLLKNGEVSTDFSAPLIQPAPAAA